MTPVLLKRLLLLFWAVWLSVVFATNLLDGLKALGVLDESWAFASGRYFSGGSRRLTDVQARQFAEDLQRAVDRLPDMEAREDRFVCPRALWGGGKDRVRPLVAFARTGSFAWVAG